MAKTISGLLCDGPRNKNKKYFESYSRQTVERLQSQLELPERLADVEIGTGDIAKIVEHGYRPDRMANNPKVISAAQLTSMLREII